MKDQTKRQGRWQGGKRVAWLGESTKSYITEYGDRESLITGDSQAREVKRDFKGGKWRDSMKKAMLPKLQGAKAFKA